MLSPDYKQADLEVVRYTSKEAPGRRQADRAGAWLGRASLIRIGRLGVS